MTIQAISNVSVNLPPSTPSAGAAPQGAPDVLPGTQALMLSGDAGAMIAALAVESGRSQKKAAMEQRRNAEANETAEQNAQIQALREKADLVRVQGIVDGAMTIGEGALNFGAQMNAASAEGHGGRAKELEADGLHFASGGEQLSAARTRAEGARFEGAAKLADGVGKVVDGLFKGAITDKDTDAEVHSQLASRAKRAVEDATGDYEDAKKLLEKALDFYKEYTGAKNGAVSAAIHRA